MKAKVGKLEKEIREGFLRRLSKEITGVVQEVVGKMRSSMRFQDRLEKDKLSKQLNIEVIRSEVEKEIGVREVETIPEL